MEEKVILVDEKGREIGFEENCFLFIMRSVLHYFGRDGLHERALPDDGNAQVVSDSRFSLRVPANTRMADSRSASGPAGSVDE